MSIEEAIKIEIRKCIKEELSDIAEDLLRIRNLIREFKIENAMESSVVTIPSNINPTIYLTTKEVSKRYGLSQHWFSQKRCRGDGPPFIKLAGKVLYSIAKTDAWFESFTKINTVESN